MISSPITVAHTIALALKRHGVEVIFGQSLPSAVILAAEMIGIRQIAYRQENMGGAMADGYARVSGQVPVVAAQNGPAATLLVPPLAEAMKASIPIVAIVQEVERHQVDKNAFQELDHVALFSSCSKWTKRLPCAERVDDYVDNAFIAAASGRPGPAVLLLPADLLREKAVAQPIKRNASYGRFPLDRPRPSTEDINSVASLICKARNPVVIAGGGALSRGAPAALAKLQNVADLPIFTTNMGKGAVDEHNPLSCGVLGALVGPTSLGRHSRELLAEADLVLQVGTRNNQNGTDNWQLIPPLARLVQVDIDPQEIGRNYEAMRLVGDAAETVEALVEALKEMDLSLRTQSRPRLESRIAEAWARFHSARAPLAQHNASPIRPERVMAELQTLLTPETIVVADASYSSMWVVGQLRALASGMRFITPRGLAGLGWGVPLAMGAKVAKPDAKVVALVGDGGFAHSWAELETMVRMDIRVTIIVLNNGVLGFQKDAETVKFGQFSTACRFSPVDHAAIARACGCVGLRVDSPGDVLPALRTGLENNRPTLIEIATDPDAHPPISVFDGTLDKTMPDELEVA
ncbi:acetolactate synthase-1/2/3 large subunit [Xaviernesmea oryzae]|uniref:Acetolactate synthase-1/2/3 large subunit n=1 Tax=Xaviernesmea oryzae TaxID=464029 RepID=A0A1X7FQB3_9HYPH|nr:acetolactate synthase catalytic subunit [Xaviernesmea oryzae]SMF56010.1 acetolactate synthase-1/2/3 large subunit [Xaviernesmea oryzae]